MEFIKLNYLKFLRRLGLNVIGFSILILLLDIISRSKTKPEDLAEGRMLGVITFGGLAFLFAIIYFLAGFWYFRIGQRLLDSIIALDVFDEAIYRSGIMYKNSTLFYTKRYLQASISGYPVLIHLEGGYESGRSVLRFDFCIMKFNRPHSEVLRFPLNWKSHPKDDLRTGINSLIQKLKDNGYPACQDIPANLE